MVIQTTETTDAFIDGKCLEISFDRRTRFVCDPFYGEDADGRGGERVWFEKEDEFFTSSIEVKEFDPESDECIRVEPIYFYSPELQNKIKKEIELFFQTNEARF